MTNLNLDLLSVFFLSTPVLRRDTSVISLHFVRVDVIFLEST